MAGQPLVRTRAPARSGAPAPAARESALVADVYRQLRRDFGMAAEPFTIHEPVPALFAGTWSVCYETLLAAGTVGRPLKEVVVGTVSQINQCPYCVDAHTIMLRAAHRADLARLVRSAGCDDQRALELVAWARATRTPDSPTLASPPFGPAEAPELIGTAVAFHYLNRMVTILLGTSPLPGPAAGRVVTERIAGAWFARATRRPKPPGRTLPLLPEPLGTPIPAWAAAASHIAGAFARMAAAVENVATPHLTPAIRALVSTRIDAWRGEQMPLGRSWVQQVAQTLAPSDQPTAQLVLLAALAPHQIDENMLEGPFQRNGNAGTIALLSWGSFLAANRVASWLWA